MGKRNKPKKAPHQITLPEPTMNQDDDDLMNELLAQLDSNDTTVQTESAHLLNDMDLNNLATKMEASEKKDAKSRFKARQARKAALLAQSYAPDDPALQARLEQEAKEEYAAIQKVCTELGLEIHEINPDGHCLFSAVAHQLALLAEIPASQATYAHIRAAAANFIQSHPDDFLPFLPAVGGEDAEGALDAGFMTPEQFDSYCKMVRETAVWGGEPEIVALSRAFNIPIHVVQGGHPSIVVHRPSGTQGDATERAVRISYHRRLYGLGEHYNSLRPTRAT
ncbi:cysteine proteinase [Pholiota conissans]|uniref:Cysteine proteinase n=1 Tax=Pholiota conissans TaxID=109636 RepID=A0A9P5Z2D0_9AGAR|nr:cysteine proteinase [Pholiota conissans]